MRGPGVFGVLAGVTPASLLTVLNLASGARGASDALVLVTTFAATVPFLLSAPAQLYWPVRGAR